LILQDFFILVLIVFNKEQQIMPIYEYECSKCGHVHEMFQKITDKPLTACPECSGKLHKLISQSAFHLKGSGWYVTDYAKRSGDTSSHASTTTEKKKTESSTPTATAPEKTEKAVTD
jgi:putative FmdB family regulatory protein